jgi:hypothetical protein
MKFGEQKACQFFNVMDPDKIGTVKKKKKLYSNNMLNYIIQGSIYVTNQRVPTPNARYIKCVILIIEVINIFPCVLNRKSNIKLV